MSELHLYDITLNRLKGLAFFLCNNINELSKLILLKGEEGSGKSTFVKYYLSYIIHDLEFQSPTYSTFREYFSNKAKILHADFYRHLYRGNYLGIEEYLDNHYICLIEWPDNINFNRYDFIKLDFFYTRNDNIRTIIISCTSQDKLEFIKSNLNI